MQKELGQIHAHLFSADHTRDTLGLQLGEIHDFHFVAAGELVQSVRLECLFRTKAVIAPVRLADDDVWRAVLEGLHTRFNECGCCGDSVKVRSPSEIWLNENTSAGGYQVFPAKEV